MLPTNSSEKVVVAVRAEKDISKTALTWALTNIVSPGDCITLLAVLPTDSKSGRKLWSFPKFNGQHRQRTPKDHLYQISESCSQILLQFNDQKQVGVRIKVVSGSPAGVVAAESKKAGANWVILDKRLEEEEKHCMEDLHCNIVVMKRLQAKVLRVNLGSSHDLQYFSTSPSKWELDVEDSSDSRIKHSTPVSSPERTTSHIRTTTEDSSISSSDAASSLLFVCESNPLFEGHKRQKPKPIYEAIDSSGDSFTSLDSERESVERLITDAKPPRKHNKGNRNRIPQNHTGNNNKITRDPTSRTLLERFVQIDHEARTRARGVNRTQMGHVFNSEVRDAVSLGRSSSAPPPLCTHCQHKAPVFGKPPRWFDYGELEEATDRFSEENSLAEGGFGSVHRGILRNGQVVAVKQLNATTSIGDDEFCREVEVLSCAQHRNVVMLIGFCIEGKKRILVYEYVCNGSLDFHLYGGRRYPLDWHSRVKIAVGTARGLRYLHEDCRVGCIVHRDVRPNNILLTHDFEPLVGDFGVTKWKPQLNLDADPYSLKALGYSGYLAPESIEGAKTTEKADIYAFGVVLKELITGRKMADITCLNRQQFPTQWYHQFLALEQQGLTESINHQLVDPMLNPDELQRCLHQLQAMARAASLCLRQDPESRPPMSKVLRMLEGGNAIATPTIDFRSIGNRSGRLTGLSSNQVNAPKGNHCRRLSH